MPRPKRDESAADHDAGDPSELSVAGPPKFKRVKIKHYKVETSQGRFLDNDWAELPEHEADSLIAAGKAQ